MASFIDGLRDYLEQLARESSYYRQDNALRAKPSAFASGEQYASRADVEALQEPAFSPVDLIDPDILKAMYIPVGKAGLNALARMAKGEVVEDVPRAFSALHDRMPRVEIDDSGMVIGELAQSPYVDRTVRDYVSGTPSVDVPYYGGGTLGDIPVVSSHMMGEKAAYLRNPFNNSPDSLGAISFNVENYPTTGRGDEMLHELQHAVQERGGFARGGSPEIGVGELTRPVLDKMEAPLRQRIDELRYLNTPEAKKEIEILRQRLYEMPNEAGMQAYRNLAGEIEARDTAARMSMNALDRARTQPYTGFQVRPDGSFGPAYDIGGNLPLEDYIIRR